MNERITNVNIQQQLNTTKNQFRMHKRLTTITLQTPEKNKVSALGEYLLCNIHSRVKISQLNLTGLKSDLTQK